MPHIVSGTLTRTVQQRGSEQDEGERTPSVKGPFMCHLQACELLLGTFFSHREKFGLIYFLLLNAELCHPAAYK